MKYLNLIVKVGMYAAPYVFEWLSSGQLTWKSAVATAATAVAHASNKPAFLDKSGVSR